MQADKGNDNDWRIARLHIDTNENDQRFETATQALGAVDWILVRIVFNVRARTSKAFRRDLAQVGIEVPQHIMESPKWFEAFHGASSLANHKGGFLGLLSARLLELGYDQCAIRNAIDYLEQEVAALCLDVQTAVARELRNDLESSGIRVPPAILASVEWRDVFGRREVQLPPGAASIVHKGTDDSLFRPIRE